MLGTALGGLFYQAFRAIVLTLFGLPYTFSFGFSLPALGLTVLYFALIYLFALRRSRKYTTTTLANTIMRGSIDIPLDRVIIS